MGSFFTNVQVRVRGMDRDKSREAVTEAIGALLAEEGFVLAANEPADRTILVHVGHDWISVYDEACEAQDPSVLDRLAQALSKRVGTEALTILLHDSDVLDLRLFQSGALLDRFNSHPSDFGKVTAAARKAAAGRADRWAPLLSAPTDAERLREAWQAKRAFAEDTLKQIAEIIGLDPGRASMGFNGANADDPQVLKIAARRADRPADAGPAEGATRFEAGFYAWEVTLVAGSPWQTACSARNTGGPSRGLEIGVWGDALDQGLLSVDSVEALTGPTESPVPHGRATFEDTQMPDGSKVRVATFADLAVPPGYRPDSPASANRPPADWRKTLDRQLVAQVQANIAGTGLTSGKANFYVGLAPATNFGGRITHKISARVHPASRRPLRAPPTVDPLTLRPLAGRGALFAIVSMDLDRTAASAVAGHAIERWGRLFEPGEKCTVYVVADDVSADIDVTTAKAKTLLGGARWTKLQDQLRTAWSVRAKNQGGDGFAFRRSGTRTEVPGDPQLPTLGLWLDVSEAAEGRIGEATKLASELMDAIVMKHRGVQALAGRWDWPPTDSLDRTPYEEACGVRGSCTLYRSWLSRYVRGVVTGTLWVGAPLAARMHDLAPLRAAVRVDSLGDGLRIVVENDAAQGPVEAALAPLLPSEDDWRREVARLYPRFAST